MYYYEKDYIMRLIHQTAIALRRLLFGDEAEGDIAALVMRQNNTFREENDYLKSLVDEGKINVAEDRLFELIESTAWDRQQAAALILAFYDDVNSRDDAFLAAADFSRDEIISGMEDAMKTIGMEIPEYLRIN